MANIEQDLQAIMEARYGKDVRQSIHDAISDINDVNEANISTVQGIADTAQGYANDASQAKTDAQTAQTGAETAQTHAETAEDGAEHFYQETLAIAQALGSALIPRGTVEFANLPSVSSSDIKDGYMWNISDPFTTTSDFVEGAGLSIPMGANVYRITINNTPKWDILAGSSAQVYTGTEAQIEQAIQQGLLGEGVMINSLDDGEDELFTTSMIYHHNESLEDVIDGIVDDLSNKYVMYEQRRHSFGFNNPTDLADALHQTAEHILAYIQGLANGVAVEILNMKFIGAGGITIPSDGATLYDNTATDFSIHCSVNNTSGNSMYLYDLLCWANTASANRISRAVITDGVSPTFKNLTLSDLSGLTGFNFDIRTWRKL